MPKTKLPLPTRRKFENRGSIPGRQTEEAVKSGVRVTNLAADTSEIFIYGYIGDDYYGVSATRVIEELDRIATPKLVIRINSAGGNIFEAAAIYNAIRRHSADEKTSAIDGIAASSASWLALAADKVTIGVGAYVMIHNAEQIAYGDADILRKAADDVEKMTANIAAIYARRQERRPSSGCH